ncbi:MAG TPA: LCP family protein [Candidatus Dormibacteraeota bacterium]|nr:LCP family protein [Candidatus Dormibacteraeota bacterium]HEV2477311.1 LCP family protein [Candidatus Dormibacteraeota bacterium]
MPRAWIVVLGFVLAGLGGLGAYFFPVLQTAGSASSGPGEIAALNPVSAPTQPFTVLLLGSDDDSKFPPDRLNTQSMILVRVDPSTRQATLLSIPRDLWVPIPEQGTGKISTAYNLGGPDGAIKAVETNFKVHIDDYVWIGLNGLVKLIDKLGGVNLQVTNPVMDDYYPADLNSAGDPYGYYRIAVLPGATHMDGVHALQYVRSRHGDIRGDFARSERQQQLLLAIKAQASHLSVADLPVLASALNGEIKTSVSIERLRALMSIASDFNSRNVHRIVLLAPYTSEGWADGQSVVFPDWAQILPLVHQTFP